MFGLGMGRMGGRRAGRVLSAQVNALFATGGQGFVDDPANLASLLQDAAGTAPVTTAGQQVGLRLDRRLGLVRGVELVVNGGFDANTSGWAASAVGTTLAVVNGELEVTGSGGNYPAGQSTAFATVVGSRYEATAMARRGSTASPVFIAATGGSGSATTVATTATPLRFVFLATTTSTNISGLIASSTGTGTAYFDNISVREIPGSHAVQTTPLARPLYQTGPARLVFDDVDDAHVTTFAAALGSNCTVVRSVPGVGTTILTAQTIGTSYTNTVTHSGLLIIDRPLTAAETTVVTRWGNQRAGL